MRAGLHTETSYPLYNCTHDTLKLLLKSSDPKVVEVAKFIKAKKERPRFDVWIVAQKKREDGVGIFARWLIEKQREEGRSWGRMSGPPETTLRIFVNARWAGVDFPDEAERGLAQALEEWDRWGV
jgi:hypothetical protein